MGRPVGDMLLNFDYGRIIYLRRGDGGPMYTSLNKHFGRMTPQKNFILGSVFLAAWIFTKLTFALYGYAHNLSLEVLPKHVWMYWESPEGQNQPGYIALALNSAQYHLGDKLQLHILNEKTIHQFLPDLRGDLVSKLNIPQRVDYYRAQLLYRYGGVWLDADTIVMNDLTPLIQKLRFHDFIGFGCNFDPDLNYCNTQMSGYPFPSNWVMISRKGTGLFSLYIQGMDALLNQYDAEYFEQNYHSLGRVLLSMKIHEMFHQDPYWSYEHISSRCIERNSHGDKVDNMMLVSHDDIDPVCEASLYFVPMYHTAPGFPDWLVKMSQEELLASDLLIGKLFRKAFKHISSPH